jgi:hypothetical protein
MSWLVRGAWRASSITDKAATITYSTPPHLVDTGTGVHGRCFTHRSASPISAALFYIKKKERQKDLGRYAPRHVHD